MRFFGSTPPSIPQLESFDPEIRVVEYLATRRSDAERGPQVRLCSADARIRMLTEGELAWVRGARGQQLAEVVVDDEIPEWACALRDVPGVVLSELVRVTKPDLDSPRRTTV